MCTLYACMCVQLYTSVVFNQWSGDHQWTVVLNTLRLRRGFPGWSLLYCINDGVGNQNMVCWSAGPFTIDLQLFGEIQWLLRIYAQGNSTHFQHLIQMDPLGFIFHLYALRIVLKNPLLNDCHLHCLIYKKSTQLYKWNCGQNPTPRIKIYILV